MMQNRWRAVGLFIMTLFGIWMNLEAAGAVGITPIYFEIKDVLQNSSVKRTVYFGRSNPSADEMAVVTLRGPAAQYIKLPQGDKVAMPKGLRNTPFEFAVEPGMLIPGVYEAYLDVLPLDLSAVNATSGSSSKLLAGARATIAFSVTGESREKWSVKGVGVKDTEVGSETSFYFQVLNEGNVDTRPAKIEVTITDATDPSKVYRETIDGGQLGFAPALGTKDYFQVTKAQLEVGSYFMKLAFHSKEGLVFESENLSFSVYPRGTLAQAGELLALSVDKDEYTSSELVQFKGEFKNTGKIGIQTTLDISIFVNDKRIDALQIGPQFVPEGQSVTFEKLYRPPQPGKYRAEGVASFGIHKTPVLRVGFTVKDKLRVVYVGMILLGPFLLLLLLMLLIRLIAKQRDKGGPPTPPSQPPSAAVSIAPTAATPSAPAPPQAPVSQAAPTLTQPGVNLIQPPPDEPKQQKQ